MELLWTGDFSRHTKAPPLGLVKTIYTERADYKEGRGDWKPGSRKPVEEISFNNKGDIVEFVTYEKGTASRRYTNTFDSNGNLVEERTFAADGGIAYATLYGYDSDGNRITRITTDADGSLYERGVYTYDTEDRFSGLLIHYPDGSLKTHLTRYFQNGVLTEKIVKYYRNSSVKSTWVKVDDSSLRVIEQRGYNAEGLLELRWRSSYDVEGRETQRDDFKGDGSLIRRWILGFDEAGNMIRRACYSPRDEIEEELTYAYLFDPIGNWIQRSAQKLIVESAGMGYRPALEIYRAFTYWPEQH